MKGFEVYFGGDTYHVGCGAGGAVSVIIRAEEGVLKLKLGGMDSGLQAYKWADSDLKAGDEIVVQVKDLERISPALSVTPYDETGREPLLK